jgi:hypothetical protein
MTLAYRPMLGRAALAAAALGIALTGFQAAPADARVVFGLGFGVPLYAPAYPPPVYYAPPPVYYAPPPVVYAPPPTIVAPAPLQQNSAAQNWYYCDASRAYYPHVTNCATGWREVAPTTSQR